MEIRISTKQILDILYVLSWIIFIGLLAEAGSFIFNALYSMYLDKSTYMNMADLYRFDVGHFLAQSTHMVIVGLLKALIFFLAIRMLHKNKINLTHPFNKETGRFIFLVSYICLGIGLFCSMGTNYAVGLSNRGVKMPSIEQMGLDGADVWVFMGIMMLIVGQIFKRGIEIQSENELTI